MTENVGVGGVGVNARFDPREMRAHLQENSRLRSEIEDWRHECQIQADRYAWAHRVIQEIAAQCVADREMFSGPDYQDPISMGRAISALFYQSMIQEKLDAMPDFDTPHAEQYVFRVVESDDRWRSTCSCGWQSSVAFTSHTVAHDAWQTHSKMRHGG